MPAHETKHLGAEEIIDHCARNLAPYKVPRQIILMQALPRNAAGKLQRRILRDTWADNA